MDYTVYIIQCSNGGLYTGIAKDLEKRLETHRQGLGSKYVRANLPFELMYKELHPDRSSASIREAQIKNLSKIEKMKLFS